MTLSWRKISAELSNTAAAPDNTLSKLSDQEIEKLAKMLAKRHPPLWESLFIKLSGLPQFNNKLDGNLLTKIRNNNTLDLERAKSFLNIIKTWPEMTLEIVAQGMDDIDDNDTANIIRGHIVSTKSQQAVSSYAQNNEPHTDSEIGDLLLAYDTNVAEQQQAYEQMMRRNMAPAAAGSQYRDPFGDDHVENAAAAAVGNEYLINSPIVKLLNPNPGLIMKIANALDGRKGADKDWVSVIRFLSQQAHLLSKFQPDPESWCESITAYYETNGEKSEAILKTLRGYTSITAGDLVTAIAATGRCFEPLCMEICQNAGAANFARNLIYDLNNEAPSHFSEASSHFRM